jgi:hypothetical protein
MTKSTKDEIAVEAAVAAEAEGETGTTNPDGNTVRRKRAAASTLSLEREAER